MKRSMTSAVGLLAVVSLTLTACGGDAGDNPTTNGNTTGGESVTLRVAGWALDSTPEFETLAEGFEEESGVTVEIVEYADGNDYDTQIISDLAAGSAPDIYVLKNLNKLDTFQSGGQLLDVSDVAAGLSDEVNGVDAYVVDGKNWAIPYRQDSWFVYYNKDLFEEAGVDLPDGSWTWDDYADTAKALTEGLDGVKGTYQHTWQSLVQGFALAQSPGADLLSGDYSYLQPYYERVLDLQDAGAQQTFGTAQTSSLTYQGEFGKQSAAMLPMGSWYVATLVAQQASGEADDFEWGIAPAPQFDESTAGTDNTPVTFGDPTGMGINPAIDESKLDAAKEFLTYIAQGGGASDLAELGVVPALSNDEVTETFFAIEGVPTDDLSRFAYSTHDTRPENVVSPRTPIIQNILNDLHSAVLSESTSTTDAIDEAEARVASEAAE